MHEHYPWNTVRLVERSLALLFLLIAVLRGGSVASSTPPPRRPTSTQKVCFARDAELGIRNLKQVLIVAGESGVEGWLLSEATGISADGAVVIGNGTNPSGHTEGWVARLPERTVVQRKTWTELRRVYRK